MEGRRGDAGLVAQMVKDDNGSVSVFATGEQAAMLDTNRHAAFTGSDYLPAFFTKCKVITLNIQNVQHPCRSQIQFNRNILHVAVFWGHAGVALTIVCIQCIILS